MKRNCEFKEAVLSIIVPVYNVQDTLERAVLSIIQQKLEDFEIILIDDGSTDKSGAICDQLAEKYTAIKAYHKKNGGLSDARNFGIKKAVGELVTFLDSDDYYINNVLVKVLMHYKKKNRLIDIICFGLEKGTIREQALKLQPEKKENLTNREAISEMLTNKSVDFYAWNKVYKTSLFQTIQFPVGKLYEDMVPVFQLFKKAERIDVLDVCGIFYYQNQESIVYQNFNAKQYDNIDQRKILLGLIIENFPDLKQRANSRLADGYLSTGFKISGGLKNKDNKAKTYYDFSTQELKKLWLNNEFTSSISTSKKMALSLYRFMPELYYYLYKFVLRK